MQEFCEAEHLRPHSFVATASPPAIWVPTICRRFATKCLGHNTALDLLFVRISPYGYVSWLVKSPQSRYYLLVDIAAIRAQFLAEDRVSLALIKMYFHALGHLFLHLHTMESTDIDVPVTWSPNQDAEAWMFAYVLWGAIMADVSATSRETNATDRAWRYA